MARCLFQRMNALAKRRASSVDRSSLFNFRDQRGANNGGIGKTAEHRNVAGQAKFQIPLRSEVA